MSALACAQSPPLTTNRLPVGAPIRYAGEGQRGVGARCDAVLIPSPARSPRRADRKSCVATTLARRWPPSERVRYPASARRELGGRLDKTASHPFLIPTEQQAISREGRAGEEPVGVLLPMRQAPVLDRLSDH